jgi:cyclase
MNPETFNLHEVVPGVWEAEADFAKPSVGNAAIIDLGGKTIVVDTFMTLVAAEELRTVAEELTGNTVYLAVNSHWHGDHTSGNQVFADVPIVSTRETLDELVATAPDDLDAWQAEIQQSIDSLQEAADGGDESAARRLGVMTAFKETAGRFSLTLPNLLIDSRLVVEGERTVEIITYGRGHTVSDTVVWLPDERLVVTGDLCWNGIHPRTQDGFPADWATYVETLLGLSPKHVIPGHGEPTDASALTPLPAYFQAVEDAIAAVARGTDPAELDAPSGTEDWQGIERFRTGVQLLAAR